MASDVRSYDTIRFPGYLTGGNTHDQLWKQPSPVSAVDRAQAALTTELECSAARIQTDVRPQFLHALSEVCKQLLGVDVVHAEFPGGKFRKSCRVLLSDGRSVIATRRNTPGRAELEERVLVHLRMHGVPVPKVWGFNGLVLIQDDISGQRLSQAFAAVDETGFHELADRAISSLVTIHRAAECANLDHSVPLLGYHPDWVTEFMDRPAVLGSYLGNSCPEPSLDDLHDLLTLYRPRFVKWDARPGNAIDSEGSFSWIDWEHCGARNRVDDLAWLLCDEFTPDFPDVEEGLLAKHLENFADGGDLSRARSYLRAFGTLHMCVRLSIILRERGDGEWWDPQYCLDTDRAGVTREMAQRLCRRAARWSAQEPIVAPLSDWFRQVDALLGDESDNRTDAADQETPVAATEPGESTPMPIALVDNLDFPAPPRLKASY